MSVVNVCVAVLNASNEMQPRSAKKAAQKKLASPNESKVSSKYFDSDSEGLEESSLDDDSDAYEEEVVEAEEDDDETQLSDEQDESASEDYEEATPSRKRKRSKAASAKASPHSINGSTVVTNRNGLTVTEIISKPIPNWVEKAKYKNDVVHENVFHFLRALKDNNEREWMKSHDPPYRQTKAHWEDFLRDFTNEVMEHDPTIPPLPPKDITMRVARDIRFSNDRTPYSPRYGAHFSRTGRKGIYGGYYLQVSPQNTFIGIGMWHPEPIQLHAIRHQIATHPQPLKDIINSPAFVKHFGNPKKGQNIFRTEDQLKTAPKNYPKDHAEIALLRLRSFAVIKKFTDDEVIAKDWKSRLGAVIQVGAPLVQWLNDCVDPEEEEDEDGQSGEDEVDEEGSE